MAQDPNQYPSEMTCRYFLSAGETDAQGRMPLSLIVERAIEMATYHANTLGIGYDRLISLGIGWVLTRFSVEMVRYPRINEYYSVTTWIEGYNRLYSDRCFVITDDDGNVIGNIRTMWVAIDMTTRTAADLTALETERFPVSDRKCPVSRLRKQQPLTDVTSQIDYIFRFSDIDFNRHVNTVQYIKHLLNNWDVDFFDRHRISRFDITFQHECYCGEPVNIRYLQTSPSHWLAEIVNPLGKQAVTAAFEMEDCDYTQVP